MKTPRQYSLFTLTTFILLLSPPSIFAFIPHGGVDSFNFENRDDHGCNIDSHNITTGCRMCTNSGVGMPIWWVSEPFINLWAADEPVSYKTSLGENIAFRLIYKQRDERSSLQPHVPQTGWHHGWFSYIHLRDTTLTNHFLTWDATMYSRSGGEYDFTSETPLFVTDGFRITPMDGVTSDVYPGPNNSPNMYGSVGFRLLYPDGSQDLYGYLTGTYSDLVPQIQTTYTTNVGGEISRYYITNSFTACDVLLSEHIDPYGNSTHFNYTSNNNYYFLSKVIDYDGKTTTLTYTNVSRFPGTNLLTRVDMPYGRSAVMLYNTNDASLISVTDAEGNQSTFLYSGSPMALSRISTLYGNTDFLPYEDPSYMESQLDFGSAGLTNKVARALVISLPDGSTNMYIYRYSSKEVGIPGQLSSPADPGDNSYDAGSPDLGYDTPAYSYYRNTFFWDARQFNAAASVSTTNFLYWAAPSYAFASVKHWLAQTNNPGYLSHGYFPGSHKISSALSWTRQASPVGDTNFPGQVQWYDYNAKEPGNPWSLVFGSELETTSTVLSDNSTRYSKETVDQTTGLPQTLTSSYSGGGGPTTRDYSITYHYETANQTVYASSTNLGSLTNILVSSWDVPFLQQVTGPQGKVLLNLGAVAGTGYTTLSRTIGGGTTNGTNYLIVMKLPQRLQLQIQNAVSDTSLASFSSRGQLLGMDFPNGLVISNAYDGDGFLARTTNYDSQLNKIATNYYSFSNGLLAARTNELGLATKYTWDRLQRLTGISFPSDPTHYISNIYSRLDLVQQIDRLGNSVNAFFDSRDRLQAVSDRQIVPNYLNFQYCNCGSLSQIVDALNGTNTFWRDFSGRVTNVQYSAGFSTGLIRDLVGQVAIVTNTAGLVVWLQYNNQGLPTSVFTTNGTLFAATFDAYDRPTNTTSAEGVVINLTYDDLGRVLTRKYPNLGQEIFTYTTNGLATYSDTLGHTTSFYYDLAGRLTSTTNANLEGVGFAYDPAGDIIALTNSLGKRTSWTYDAFGRCIAETNANGILIITNGYDPNGNLIARWTKTKGLALFTPDPNGNVVSVTYSNFSNTYTYDGLNRLTQLTDPSGTTTFSYTNFGALSGALASEDGPWTNDKLTYVYANGLLASLSLTQPSGSWDEAFAFDNQLRLRSLTTQNGMFTNGYFGAGHLIQRTGLPGGNYIDNNFTSSGMLQDTWLKSAAGTTLNHHGYLYDMGYYRTNATRTDTSHISYAYDNIGQLVKATGYDTNGTTIQRLNEAFGYGYDKAGNLTSRTNGVLTQTFGPDNLNQLASIARNGSMTVAGLLNLAPQTGSLLVNGVGAAIYNDLTFATTNGVSLVNGNNTFVTTLRNSASKAMTNSPTLNLPSSVSLFYDYDGNLTNDGLRFFEYDDADRLTAVTVSNSWRSEYVYDGLWRRRMLKQYGWSANAWNLTNETHYLYQGMLVIQERNSANSPLVTYTRGLDLSGSFEGAGGIGGLLARTDNTSGTPAFYHADAGGNVTGMINSSGTVQAKYLYDPFGNTIAMSGTLASVNKYRFSSKEVDTVSGEYYFGHRFYDANLQRWLNRDPIGLWGGLNLFGFVGNNPMSYQDASGFGYGNVVSGPAGPVGPSSSYVPGFPFFPDGSDYHPRPTPVPPPFPNPTYPQPRPEVLWDQYTGSWYDASGIRTDDDIFFIFVPLLDTGAGIRLSRCTQIGETGKVGENALKSLGGESQAGFKTSLGMRYTDQLVNGAAHESKVGYQSLTSTIRSQIAKDAELLNNGTFDSVNWHFFQSPVTGLKGASQPLIDALNQNGFNVIIH